MWTDPGDLGDRGDGEQYPYVGDGGHGQRGDDGTGEWYGDGDGVPCLDTVGLMYGEHREDRTIPGDFGAS